MTRERALTSLARCRNAIRRAQDELSEVIRIVDHLAGPRIAGEPADRAARALRITELQRVLDELSRSLSVEALAGSVAEGGPPKSNGHRRRGPVPPLQEFEGEYPPIAEHFVVSPGRGRIHLRRIREGRLLAQDAVIAELRAGTAKTPIRISTAAVFVSWLASEGEAVSRGRMLARVRPHGE